MVWSKIKRVALGAAVGLVAAAAAVALVAIRKANRD